MNKKPTEDMEFEVDSEGDIDPLKSVPKSERQKRKEKLKKQRERERELEERGKRKESQFEVVPAAGGVADNAVGNLASEEQRRKQELIKAGMGKALDDEVRTCGQMMGCVACERGLCSAAVVRACESQNPLVDGGVVFQLTVA